MHPGRGFCCFFHFPLGALLPRNTASWFCRAQVFIKVFVFSVKVLQDAGHASPVRRFRCGGVVYSVTGGEIDILSVSDHSQ